MKALIISDVHANIDALKSVVEAEADADIIYCAGDIVDYGLNPGEVIAYLREKKIITVMGNHDRNLLRIVDENLLWDKKSPMTFAQHCAEVMTKEEIDFVRGLPAELAWEMDGVEYFMTHRYDPGYKIIESRNAFQTYWNQKYPGSDPKKEHCCIFGHTHRSCFTVLDDKMRWLNPGSISYRREDDPVKGADYAVIVDRKISLKHVPYPHRHLYERVLSMNLTENEARVGKFFFGD